MLKTTNYQELGFDSASDVVKDSSEPCIQCKELFGLGFSCTF